jgi:ubiquinone/menaquinone biosynthesis C-methylase UbiE
MADWDTFASDYDRIFLENPAYVEILDTMARQLEPREGLEVLDLGCGTGNATAAVLEHVAEARVTAMDPSAGMRDTASKRFKDDERVTVKEGDALNIPASDASFDALISNLAIHHVAPELRPKGAAEMARVLRPGGTLLYSDMFTDIDSTGRDPERMKDLIDKQAGMAAFCLDHGAFDMAIVLLQTLPADLKEDGEYKTTTGVWEALLDEAGFDIERVMDFRFGLRIIVGRRR